MELGQLAFGNAVQQCPIDRDWQDRFQDFLINLGFDGHGLSVDEYTDSLYREDIGGFDTGNFIIRPYYWGDCTCGFDEADYQWSVENDHREHCFQTQVKNDLINNYNCTVDQLGIIEKPTTMDNRAFMDLQNTVYKKWANHFNLSHQGYAIHCTCNHTDRYIQFLQNHGHDDYCPIVLPNFYNKTNHLIITWYKYPLRGAYANMPFVDIDDFMSYVTESSGYGVKG